MPQEDVLDALRRANGDVIDGEPVSGSREPGRRVEERPLTANQRKIKRTAAVRKVFDGNKFIPVLALGGVFAICIGGLATARVFADQSAQATAQQAAVDNTDWKTRAVVAENNLAGTQRELEQSEINQIRSNPALKALKAEIPAPRKPIASSLPAPIGPAPKTKPIRQFSRPVARSIPRQYPRLEAPPSRLLATSVKSGVSPSMGGVVVNEEYKKGQPKLVADATKDSSVKDASVSVNTNGIAAYRQIKAKLIGRLAFVGSTQNEVPIQAEVIEPVTSKGNVVLPAGSVLVGKIAKSSKQGYVELNFTRGRFPGDAASSFPIKAIATATDGGILVVPAPKRADGTASDLLAVGLSFAQGSVSAGLNSITQSNNGFGGINNTVTQTTNTNPVSEGIRSATGKAISVVDTNAQAARADSQSGNLDFQLPVGTEIQIMPIEDLSLPSVN